MNFLRDDVTFCSDSKIYDVFNVHIRKLNDLCKDGFVETILVNP
jgi:hypothetical protein